MNPKNPSLSAQVESAIRTPKQTGRRVANPRTLRALDNIVQACDKLAKLNQRISASAVGTMTEGLEGGPTRGGLRNSKEFTAYVKARASEQHLSPHTLEAGARILRTGNSQIDADIAAMSAHNVMLSKQNRYLTKLLQNLGYYDLGAAIEKGELILAESRTGPTITQAAREAISALVDNENLRKVGLELTPGGQLTNPRLRIMLLNARQVAALRALLQDTSESLPS